MHLHRCYYYSARRPAVLLPNHVTIECTFFGTIFYVNRITLCTKTVISIFSVLLSLTDMDPFYNLQRQCRPTLRCLPDSGGSSQEVMTLLSTVQYSFQASFSRQFPHPKKLTIPPNGCQIVCSKSFFSTTNYRYISHGNFLLVDNKHKKLFVIKQSNGANLCLKWTRIRWGSGRTRWGAYALPQIP